MVFRSPRILHASKWTNRLRRSYSKPDGDTLFLAVSHVTRARRAFSALFRSAASRACAPRAPATAAHFPGKRRRAARLGRHRRELAWCARAPSTTRPVSGATAQRRAGSPRSQGRPSATASEYPAPYRKCASEAGKSPTSSFRSPKFSWLIARLRRKSALFESARAEGTGEHRQKDNGDHRGNTPAGAPTGNRSHVCFLLLRASRSLKRGSRPSRALHQPGPPITHRSWPAPG